MTASAPFRKMLAIGTMVLLFLLTHNQSGAQTAYFVNNNSTAGDVFTSAIGSNANGGTRSAPFATIEHAYGVAQAGDTIFVDAGTYTPAGNALSLNKTLVLLGTNFQISPNQAGDKRLANGARNSESIISEATLSLGSSGVVLGGLTFSPGVRPAVNFSSNTAGNLQFSRNRVIATASNVISLLGVSAANAAALTSSNYSFTDNRIERHGTGTSSFIFFNLGFLKNIQITNNAFTAADGITRNFVVAMVGNPGIVDNFTYSDNTSNHSNYDLFTFSLANATISGNKLYNSQNTFFVQAVTPGSTKVQILNNQIESALSVNNLIVCRVFDTADPGAVNETIIEDNTVNINATGLASIPPAIVTQFAQTTLDPRLSINRNKITHSGSYSSMATFTAINLAGRNRQATISSNELRFTGSASPTPSLSSGTTIPFTGINIPSEVGASTMPAGSTITLNNNLISGYRQSIIFYDANGSADNPYVGYGNLPAGVNVSASNNSFTGDSISINNGSIGTPVTATCNWFGTASGDLVATKVSANVSNATWLTSGTDASSSTGFQPIANSCNGILTRWYVNDNNSSGDIFTTANGNDNNPGTASQPFATIGRALTAASDGDIIFIDAGTYTGQVTIQKGITLKGAGRGITTIQRGINGPLTPLPSGGPGVIQSTVTTGHVVLQNLTVDGNNGTSSYSGSTYAILLRSGGSISGCDIRNMQLQTPGGPDGHGIYISYQGSEARTMDIRNNRIFGFFWTGLNVQGTQLATTIENNEINATGAVQGVCVIGGWSGVSLPQLQFANNTLRGYNSSGLTVNAQAGSVTNNSFTGTGTAKAIQNTGALLAGSCNWFGMIDQQGVMAMVTGPVSFSPWLIDGTDNSAETGFQPVGNSCNGKLSRFYVNDNSLSGNVFTTAVGNDNNPGTPSAPLATLAKALATAAAGDTIFIDAGLYPQALTSFTIDKPITLLGTNYNVGANASGNVSQINGGRHAESVLSSATISLGANNVTIAGFKLAPGTRAAIQSSNTVRQNITLDNNILELEGVGVLVTGTSTLPIQSANINIRNNRFEAKDTLVGSVGIQLGGWKNVTITGNAFMGKIRSNGVRFMSGMNNPGLTMDTVTVTGNHFDLLGTGFACATSSNAIISSNTFDRNDLAMLINWSNASVTNVQIKANQFTRTRSNGQLFFRHSGNFAVGNVTISENVIDHDVAAGTIRNYPLIRLELYGAGNGGPVIVEKNNIRIYGDYAGTTGNFAGIQIGGRHFNTTVRENNFLFEAINKAPGNLAFFPSNTGILLSTDNGATFPAFTHATRVSILNNKVQGFTNSLAPYDGINHALSTYVGYGSMPPDGVFTITNNSFTGDSISVNNGLGPVLSVPCNWFGSASAAVVSAKITANVQVGQWLTNGTDNSAEPGFQPTANSCNGVNNSWYVNDNTLTGDAWTTTVGNDENNGFPSAPFATITKAIAMANVGDTIYVDAGTYEESVVVNKQVTIRGVQFGNSPGSNLSRGSETVIIPVATDVTDGNLFTVRASNVVIDGFTFDGDNPALTNGNNLNGVDVNAARAIANGTISGGWSTVNNLGVRNNIFKNINRNAVLLSSGNFDVFSGNSISHNRMDNICSWTQGRAILLERNAYASVTNNRITRTVVGIQNSAHNAASAAPVTISNNYVQSVLYGVYFLSNLNNAGSFIVENDSIARYRFVDYVATGKPANEFNNGGLAFLINSGDINFSINNNSIDGYANGVWIGQTVTTSPIVVNGGTISNSSTTGVLLSNFFTAYSNGNQLVTLNNVSLLNNATGAYVLDNPNSPSNSGVQLSLTGTTSFSGGNYGLMLSGRKATLAGNSVTAPFTGQAVAHLYLLNNAFRDQPLDATGATFNGLAPGSMSLSQLFALEDRIHHSVDQDSAGFVRVKVGNVYVTPSSFVSPALRSSVQRALNTASDNDTVHAAAGIYTGQLTISKPLTLQGVGKGQTVIERGATGSLLPPSNFSDPAIIQSDVTTGQVSILDLTVDGNNGTSSYLGPTHGILLQSGGVIAGCEITNMQLQTSGSPEGNGIFVNYNGAEPASVVIHENRIHNITWVGMNIQGSELSATVTSNEVDASGSSFGMAIAAGVWNGSNLAALQMNNNLVTSFSGFGLMVGANTALVNYNHFAGTGGAPAIDNRGAELDATCNWFGYGAAEDIQFVVNGPVVFTPWLSSGTDTDPSIGFQPVANSCNGTPITVIISDPTHVTCYGAANGTVTASVTGGVAPFTYEWIMDGDPSFFENTASLTGLQPGTYTVIVTDSLGSSVMASVTINGPEELITSGTGTNVSCNGARNGTITTTTEGGVAPYTYLWNNGATSSGLSGLAPGTYTLTVTDANGCTTITGYTITQPARINANVESTNITCANAADGTITLSPSGGVAPYQYSLNGGTFTNIQPITNLAPGTYTLVVADANGCTSAAVSVTLTQPQVLEITLNASVTELCPGQQNGTLNVTITGGTARYTYSWTGPNSFTSTREDISGLAAGTYNLEVTDSKGCKVSQSFMITTAPDFLVTGTATPVRCFGESSGAIELTTPAAGSFTYSWTGPNGFRATTRNLTGIKAGSYSVVVTSSAGCTQSASFTITQPGSALSLVASKTDINSCGGTGRITATASGGTAPYQFTLNNGTPQSTGSFSNLATGTYTVRVTDDRGCMATTTLTVADNGTDAYELNNRQTAAKVIALNTVIQARIAPTATDLDWYSFTTTSTLGQVYTLSLSHPTVSYLFDLYDSRGRVIAPSSSTATSKVYSGLALNTSYAIQVRGSQSSLTCYALGISNGAAVTRIAAPEEPAMKDIGTPASELKALAYPNPHQGNVTIQVQSSEDGPALLELFGSNGQKVLSRTYSLQKGSTTIPLYGLRQGLLLYRITTGQGQVTGKLVGGN